MNDGPNSVPCILDFPDLGLVGVACPRSAWSLRPRVELSGVFAPRAQLLESPPVSVCDVKGPKLWVRDENALLLRWLHNVFQFHVINNHSIITNRITIVIILVYTYMWCCLERL